MKVNFVYHNNASYEYIASYVKGKKNLKNPKIEDMRILVKDENGEELLIWLSLDHPFFGTNIDFNSLSILNVSQDLIKNGSYRYYRIESNPEHLKDIVVKHSQECKMISTGGYIFRDVNTIPNYKGMYIIDGIYY